MHFLAAVRDSWEHCPLGLGFGRLVLAAGSFQLFYLIAVTELISCDPQEGADPGRQQTALERVFLLKYDFILFHLEGEEHRHLPDLLQVLWI